MMLQLDPPLPMMTPKGEALAHVLIDYGAEHDLLWVTFQDSGECWTWRNSEIRAMKNITMGRTYGTDGVRTVGVHSELGPDAGIQGSENGICGVAEFSASVTPVFWTDRKGA